MSRNSVRENKSKYQIARENMGFSREKASECMNLSKDVIERVENGKRAIRPEEVLIMSQIYKQPELCNFFCTHECPIGTICFPEIKIQDLSQIILELIATLNSTEKKKDRLIEITVDGIISEDEMEDFILIQNELERISMTIASLNLWVEKTKTDDRFDNVTYERLKEKLKNK